MIKEIDDHCINNGKYGFTIPYLHKIEKDAGREKSISNIIEFFTTAEKKYIITYCSDLQEYIIGLPKKEQGPIHFYENFGNLHYDDEKLRELKSLSDLIAFMENKYQIRIDAGTFSKIDEYTWE